MLLPLLSLALAVAQDAPLLRSTFEKDEDGWVATQPAGTGGKLSVVHEKENVKIGAGSLRLDYALGPGQIAGTSKPLAPGSMAKMGSLHFWVRSQADTPLAVSVQEKDGAVYTSLFTVPKGGWQEVEIGVRDFTPNVDVAAPDPDGRLDPSEIESVSLFDLAQFIAQVPALSELLGVKPESRSLLVSDFQIVPKAVPDASRVSDAEFLVDDFSRPQPAWAVLNAMSRIVSEAPLGAPALRLDSNLASAKAAGAFRKFRPGSLVGKTTLNLRVASANPCQVIVQLEEANGGKYNATLSIPGGTKAVDQTIKIADMTPDGQTKDPNGKLDLDGVGQITLVDVTAITEAPGANTLWIGKIAAKP